MSLIFLPYTASRHLSGTHPQPGLRNAYIGDEQCHPQKLPQCGSNSSATPPCCICGTRGSAPRGGGSSCAPLPCLCSHWLTWLHWCPDKHFPASPSCPHRAQMAGRWAAPTRQSLGWAQRMFLYRLGKWFLIFFCVCPSLAQETASPTSTLSCSTV